MRRACRTQITTPERAARALAALEPEAEGLPETSKALTRLAGDPDVAWQCFAMVLLAETLAGDDD